MNRHRIVIGALCVMLAGALVFGAWQSQRALKTGRRLEETCQSALAGAVDQLGGMHIRLEKLLLTRDWRQASFLLSQISRGAAQAHSCLSYLPLSHQAMEEAVAFCARAGEYTQALLKKEAPTPQDEAQLEAMAAQARLLWGQLELSRQQMQGINGGFVGADSLFYRAPEGEERPVEQLYSEETLYPTLIYDGPFSDGQRQGEPRGLPEGEVTRLQAAQIARDFVGEGVIAVETAPDTLGEIPTWGFAVQKQDVTLNVEVTRRGGKVLWMMPEHADFEPRMTLEDCRANALSFLKSRGFGPMEANHYQVYGGLVTMNFSAVEGDVLLYPDQVKVQCRLDTGEVVGLEAHSYWMNHGPREPLEPELSLRQAGEKVSEKLKVFSRRLCLIPWLEGERLCYEFAGTWEGNEYRVYVDAQTGEQAEILKIVPTGDGVMSL